MVSRGRSFAVAAAVLAGVVGGSAYAFTQIFASREGWDAFVPGLALAGVVCLTPIGLLAAGLWITARHGAVRSAVGLGVQAALLGLVPVVLATAAFIAAHW